MSDLRSAAVAVSRAADRQQLLWAGGTVMEVVLGGEQTAGSLALLEQRGRRGDATPLHLHHDEAEVFYLLSGRATAWAGDTETTLEEGTAVWLPPALAHAIRVVTETARILTLTTPARFADFVREAGVPVTGDVPATWEFDLGPVLAAAPRHGIEILGPPPGSA